MKRSERMAKLHRINQLHEKQAAINFASASQHHDQLQSQLQKLEEYWNEYSVKLEELKSSTNCAAALREHQQFLHKLDEAIAQQRTELEKSATQLEASQNDLLDRSVEVKKIEKATASIRKQELANEHKKTQKETDELYAKRP